MFDFLTPGVLNAAGTGLDVFGRISSANSDLQGGRDARASADFQAAQLRQNAGLAQATAQREALTTEQHAQLVASRALAVAAASGGGASDPTVVNIMAGIAGEGAYRHAVALYNGDEQARQLQLHATGLEASGRAAEDASKRNAFGKFIGAGASAVKGIAKGQSLLDKYGGKGSPATSGDFARMDRGSPGWDGGLG